MEESSGRDFIVPDEAGFVARRIGYVRGSDPPKVVIGTTSPEDTGRERPAGNVDGENVPRVQTLPRKRDLRTRRKGIGKARAE